MNLAKLFEMQKVLRHRINYNEPDRSNKLILALLVELGECANEWRGFKFWSKDQEPRTKVPKYPTMNYEDIEWKNPLLEEYVDGLHFVMEIGIEKGIDNYEFAAFICDDVTRQLLHITKLAVNLFGTSRVFHEYRNLIQLYLGLGEMLGFTWEQIEQAYIEKNEINHKRQETGY